jgi:hypothetical protein
LYSIGITLLVCTGIKRLEFSSRARRRRRRRRRLQCCMHKIKLATTTEADLKL